MEAHHTPSLQSKHSNILVAWCSKARASEALNNPE